MGAVPVGRKPARKVKAGGAARDHVKNSSSDDRTGDLGDEVGKEVCAGKASAGPEPEGHGGVQMAPGDVSDGISHGQHREAEGQGDTQKPDAQVGKRRGQHSTTTPAQD